MKVPTFTLRIMIGLFLRIVNWVPKTLHLPKTDLPKGALGSRIVFLKGLRISHPLPKGALGISNHLPKEDLGIFILLQDANIDHRKRLWIPKVEAFEVPNKEIMIAKIKKIGKYVAY